MSLPKHLPGMGQVAGGNHRAAQNDEPELREPGDLTAADLSEIDHEFHISDPVLQAQRWRENGVM